MDRLPLFTLLTRSRVLLWTDAVRLTFPRSGHVRNSPTACSFSDLPNRAPQQDVTSVVRVWESVNGQPHHSVGHYVGQCGRKGLSTWGFYIPSPAVNQGRILIVVFEHRGKGLSSFAV